MDLLSHDVHQPATVFLPSDEALVSLPPEQKNFLFHKENRPQLVEYLKFHILPAQKVTRERESELQKCGHFGDMSTFSLTLRRDSLGFKVGPGQECGIRYSCESLHKDRSTRMCVGPATGTLQVVP